ncbi:substrate-binding periplasmic protein [Cognaticolwellia mytili]|uniref:substrate-binding periplasmic protein n=1 Tax=Cognaticolwellia mytili TaxID=1888913 RepID=UPI000A175DCC|nr:ABC transporter substrate-binding protein [Cognaticolwellia mytili]
MLKIYVLALKLISPFILILLTFSHANSRELVIFSSNAPPHMIAANGTGIDIDIVKTILTDMGHNITVEFSPLKRAMEQVKKKEADAFLPTFFQKDSDNIFISNAFIQYRPMIFSLKKSRLAINSFTDLQGLRIVSFQGATGYFGEAFHQATKQANYTELHDMSKFPEMLLMARYDAVVLDYYIFYYFLKMYQEQSELAGNGLFPLIDNYSSMIKRHDLIPEVNAYVGFNDEILRNEFNIQLKKFIGNNRQNRIIEKYIGTISTRIFALSTRYKSSS